MSIIDFDTLFGIVLDTSKGVEYVRTANWGELAKLVKQASEIGTEYLPYAEYYASPMYSKEAVEDFARIVNQNYNGVKTAVAPVSSVVQSTTSATASGVTSTAPAVLSVEYTAGGGTVATSAGLSAAVGVAELVGAVAVGCGLGVVAYDLAPEFWVDVSNAILTPFGVEPVDYEYIKNYKLSALLKEQAGEALQYVPLNLILSVYEKLKTMGVFNGNTDYPIVDETVYKLKYNVNDFIDFFIEYQKNVINKYGEISAQINYSTAMEAIKNSIINTLPLVNADYRDNLIEVNMTIGFNDIRGTFFFLKNPPQILIEREKEIIINSGYWYEGVTNGYEVQLVSFLYDANNNNVRILSNILTTRQVFGLYGGGISQNKFFTTLTNSTAITGLIYKGFDKIGSIADPSKTFIENYPEWYSKAIDIGVFNKDITGLDTIKMLPINVPAKSPLTTSTTLKQNEAQSGVLSGNAELENSAVKNYNESAQNTPSVSPGYPIISPSTPAGSNNISGEATASVATGLYKIYNPTESQISNFAKWLWTPNFVEQLLKLFADPMQAIIGLHIIYVTPITGGDTTIKCGYLDSNVPSKFVSNQYTKIDCGTIKLNEYYGNVYDFYPNTTLQIYLPFVGIREISVNDAMPSEVNIIAKVDVLTGALLYEIYINRNGLRQCMYTFNGNCAVSLPLSSGSYANIITSVISLGVGVAGTALSGGALAPALIGGGMALLNNGTDIKTSGNLGSNVGAMGSKKPYVILRHKVPYIARDFNKMQGGGSNNTVQLKNCSGYTRVKNICLLQSLKIPEEAYNNINELLKSGVII